MHDRGQLEGGGVRAVTWAGTTDTDLVTGSLKQVYKRAIRQQAFCRHRYSLRGPARYLDRQGLASNFLFTGGEAQVSASVTACNIGGCTTANTQGTVKPKLG